MLYTSSFSPINFKLGIFFSLSIFFYTLLSCKRKQAIVLSYIYGISIFTSGISWIYTSIYYYGGGNLVISLLMTVSLIIFLSLFIAPLGFFLNKNYKDKSFITLLIIPSVWVALELLRSIIFGGFPWLIAGHSQEGTIFNMIYPIAGSYFVSFLIGIISLGITLFFKSELCKSSLKNIFILVIFFHILYFYNPVWTIDQKEPLKISILQPNINVGIKYDNDQINFIKQKYLSLLSDNVTNNNIILPETAIPIIYERDKNFYNSMLKSDDTNIITGIFHYEASQNKIYNSMLVLNKDEKFYNKRHLVPFGEYTPFKIFFSYIANKLNIPMSNLSHGNLNQKPFLINNITIHPLICYEIAYSSLINMTKDYSIIINISNDSWFGNTFAPYQHLQIAQVRALETAHPIIRAANTGISALIDKNGLIVKEIRLDTEGLINGKVYPSKGISPYMYFGDYPVLMLIFSIMLFYWKCYRKYE